MTRHAEIINGFISLLNEKPFDSITINSVARRLEISPTLVVYYFGTLSDLQDAVIAHGVKQRNAAAILAGLCRRHPDAVALSASVKSQAAREV